MKSLVRLALGVAVLAGTASFVASAQSVISAKSGVIHYAEGRVLLNDQVIESRSGLFPDIKENQQVRTEEGRVEILLTPGVFLRLGRKQRHPHGHQPADRYAPGTVVRRSRGRSR